MHKGHNTFITYFYLLLPCNPSERPSYHLMYSIFHMLQYVIKQLMLLIMLTDMLFGILLWIWIFNLSDNHHLWRSCYYYIF